MTTQLDLPLNQAGEALRRQQAKALSGTGEPLSLAALKEELAQFKEFGQKTEVSQANCPSPTGQILSVPIYLNEFWTPKQRAGNSLHEISYRACFKPQLPRFFISRLTRPGDRVYDPFMGRGTTLLETALLGRIPVGNDISPLSKALIRPRLRPPQVHEIEQRLHKIDFHNPGEMPKDLLVFYHPETLRQISSLRKYLQGKRQRDELDAVDDWIALVGLNRLTGHSKGFFSVYTLPPNQAVSVRSQKRINLRREQHPTPKEVPAILMRKSRQLLRDCGSAERETLGKVALQAVLLTRPAAATSDLAANSVDLTVTSPPFLNVVDYATDNWLRCWFLGIDPGSVPLTTPSRLPDWEEAMTKVFHELMRITKPDGYVAFEVGEVSRGTVRLEESVVPCGCAAGFVPELVMINSQVFTKTANCWGIANNAKGTNSNRVVVFRKP